MKPSKRQPGSQANRAVKGIPVVDMESVAGLRTREDVVSFVKKCTSALDHGAFRRRLRLIPVLTMSEAAGIRLRVQSDMPASPESNA